MRDHLITEYGIDPDIIRMFSMGVSSRDFYYSEGERQEARRSLGLGESAIVVSSNRRMRPQYRVDVIVRAFAILRSQSSRYRLVLFEGDSIPRYATAVQRLVEDLDIGDQVLFLRGFHDPCEVRRFLLASDLVISIPTSDQLSASILEAMACGARVLGADLPAYRELFEAGLMLRAPIISPEALAQSIESIAGAIDSAPVSVGAVRAWLDRDHSDAAVSQRIVEFYASVGNDDRRN